MSLAVCTRLQKQNMFVLIYLAHVVHVGWIEAYDGSIFVGCSWYPGRLPEEKHEWQSGAPRDYYRKWLLFGNGMSVSS